MSQLNAQAQKANQTKRQLSLALQSAQITNANINFNFNLSNHLSSNSAGASTPDATRRTNHSAGEQLRTVPQQAEHQPISNATAQQPKGIQHRPAHLSPEPMAGLQRHPSCHNVHEMPSPEDGEIQQPISPIPSNQPQLPAANLLFLSSTNMQQPASLPTNEEYKYYLNDKEEHQYSSNDNATISHQHHKHISISNNADINSGCLHATMRLPNNNNSQPSLTTTVEQLSSTIAVEQRSARKQPCTRWNEPLNATANSQLPSTTAVEQLSSTMTVEQ